MPPLLKWHSGDVDLEAVVNDIVESGAPRFSVDPQGGLLDPYGQRFTPVGLNMNGQNWVWGDDVIGRSDHMADWSFNTIRVNNFIEAPGYPGAPAYHNNDDLAAMVEEYTSQRYVVILCNHTYGTTTQTDPAPPERMARLIDWWLPWAELFKDNPYVWFNPCNEPTGAPSGYTGPYWGLDIWEFVTTGLADAISEVAPNSMLMFDGHTAGQDRSHPNCSLVPDFNWPPFSYTAAINKGQTMQTRYGRNRVIMSAHFYNIWAGAGSIVSGCEGPTDDPYLHYVDDMNYYFDTMRDLGIPMVIGEWGCRDDFDEEWFMEGNKETAHMLAERVLPNRTDPRPGVLFWHGSGGDLRYLQHIEADGGIGIDQNQAFDWDGDLAKLNFQGQAMLAYAQTVNP